MPTTQAMKPFVQKTLERQQWRLEELDAPAERARRRQRHETLSPAQ